MRISSPYGIAYINEGLILNLAFASSPSCAPTPSKWSVVKDLPEGEAVKLPEYPSTVSGWFKIVPSSLKYLYKVVFCASSGGTCGEVGISVDDEGMRRLVVTEDEGIMIRFTKGSSIGVPGYWGLSNVGPRRYKVSASLLIILLFEFPSSLRASVGRGYLKSAIFLNESP